METISAEEFKKRYGTSGFDMFKQEEKKEGAISRAFKGGIEQVKKGYEQGKSNNIVSKTEGGLNMIAGGINAATSPLAAITEPTIGRAINYASDKISDIPAVQKFAGSKVGEVTERVAEDVANVATITGTVAAPKLVGGVARGAAQKVGGAGKAVVNSTKSATKNLPSAVRDIVPTAERIVDEQIAKALDLTPGDLSNIGSRTGNEVSRWLADNNLIGVNKEATRKAIQDFGRLNYENVRSEIGKVNRFYKPYQIPRYVDALKQIDNKIKDTPGLESIWVEVQNLLKKEDITLNDVQRVKELLDDHFSLYKVTGDVGEGVAKEGLNNIRKELKEFIEVQVKKETGADIKAMNNNVMTARSIDDAIEVRSPKGLTKSNIRQGDLATLGFGSFVGGPIVGLAALFIKKVVETPTVRLRIAREVDRWSDAKKAAALKELEQGNIPPDFNKYIKSRPSSVPGN